MLPGIVNSLKIPHFREKNIPAFYDIHLKNRWLGFWLSITKAFVKLKLKDGQYIELPQGKP